MSLPARRYLGKKNLSDVGSYNGASKSAGVLQPFQGGPVRGDGGLVSHTSARGLRQHNRPIGVQRQSCKTIGNKRLLVPYNNMDSVYILYTPNPVN